MERRINRPVLGPIDAQSLKVNSSVARAQVGNLVFNCRMAEGAPSAARYPVNCSNAGLWPMTRIVVSSLTQSETLLNTMIWSKLYNHSSISIVRLPLKWGRMPAKVSRARCAEEHSMSAGFIAYSARRCPMVSASRWPRSAKGRSISLNSGADFA